MKKLSQNKAKYQVKAASVSLCRTFTGGTSECLQFSSSQFQIQSTQVHTGSMLLPFEANSPCLILVEIY